MNEPLTNITNSKQQKLVIGGEVCMWGEHIDGSDIEQTIWPRAAAAAGTYCVSLECHNLFSEYSAACPIRVVLKIPNCTFRRWNC